MAATPEGKVKDAVKRGLIARGIVPLADVIGGRAQGHTGFFFMPVAGPYSVLGIHDFVGCWNSVFFSLETKAPNNPDDETFHQGKFREAVSTSGGIALTGVRDANAAITYLEQRVLEITRGRELSGAR